MTTTEMTGATAAATTGVRPVPGGRLAYQVSGDGPAVVLIHGFGLDMRMWDPHRLPGPALARARPAPGVRAGAHGRAEGRGRARAGGGGRGRRAGLPRDVRGARPAPARCRVPRGGGRRSHGQPGAVRGGQRPADRIPGRAAPTYNRPDEPTEVTMTTTQEITSTRTMAGAGAATGARDRAAAVLVTPEWLEAHRGDPAV